MDYINKPEYNHGQSHEDTFPAPNEYYFTGTHLIEWVYIGGEPHDNNQRDNRWAYIGIEIDGIVSCLIFGSGKY